MTLCGGSPRGDADLNSGSLCALCGCLSLRPTYAVINVAFPPQFFDLIVATETGRLNITCCFEETLCGFGLRQFRADYGCISLRLENDHTPNLEKPMRKRCSCCGTDLPDDSSGSCPKCGSNKRSILVSAGDKMGLSESVRWRSHREYYQKHPMVFAVVLFLSFAFPFAGYFVENGWGVVIGLLCNALTLYLGPYASTLVKQTRQG